MPVVDLHTPEELLDGAEVLYASANPKMMRAAVLESITALEAFLYKTVFSALKEKLDPLLVKWLEDKTRMDFESRLSVLAPVAIGRPIDKKSRLWQDYKKSKAMRNKITHSGRRVSQSEARFVIDTVYHWLAYLGSTVELEVALMCLKRYIEEARIPIQRETDAIRIIHEYFQTTKAVSGTAEVWITHGARRLVADSILEFGSYKVLIETKFSRGRSTVTIVEQAIEQLSLLMHAANMDHGTVVIFQKGEIQLGFEAVRKYRDGSIYVVVIKVE